MNGDRDADLPDCPLPGPCRGRPSSFADYRLVATRAPWDNDRSPGDPPLRTSAFPVAVCSAIARPRPSVLDPAYGPAVCGVGRPQRFSNGGLLRSGCQGERPGRRSAVSSHRNTSGACRGRARPRPALAAPASRPAHQSPPANSPGALWRPARAGRAEPPAVSPATRWGSPWRSCGSDAIAAGLSAARTGRWSRQRSLTPLMPTAWPSRDSRSLQWLSPSMTHHQPRVSR